MTTAPCNSKGLAVPKTKKIGLYRRDGAMFSNLWEATCFLRWAQANKLTPVVDFQSSQPMNRRDAPHSDAWGDYFEPVSAISVADAVADPDVVLYSSPRGTQFPVHEYSQDPEYRTLFTKYIRLNPMMTDYVALWSGFLEERGSALGVHARGTDMRTAKSHLAPPEDHQLFRMVDKALERSNFDSIFVASEDERSLTGFVKRYGSLVVTTDSFRLLPLPPRLSCCVVVTVSLNRVAQITCPATRIRPKTWPMAVPSLAPITRMRSTRPTSTTEEPDPISR
jgi:hypothetical protein